MLWRETLWASEKSWNTFWYGLVEHWSQGLYCMNYLRFLHITEPSLEQRRRRWVFRPNPLNHTWRSESLIAVTFILILLTNRVTSHKPVLVTCLIHVGRLFSRCCSERLQVSVCFMNSQDTWYMLRLKAWKKNLQSDMYSLLFPCCCWKHPGKSRFVAVMSGLETYEAAVLVNSYFFMILFAIDLIFLQSDNNLVGSTAARSQIQSISGFSP